MQNKQNTKAKVIVVAIAILLCLALIVGITGAFYQAQRRATGTVKMDKGIVIDYKGFGKGNGVWVRENETSFRLFSDTDVQPGEKISPVDSGIRANASSVDFYARVKLDYEFYNGETPVELADATKLIKTSSSFFGTNWVESGDGYYYYAAGSTLNKFEKGTQTFVDLFATDAKFIIEGAGFTGAENGGEGGGFVVGDTSINKIEVYLTLETLQGDVPAEELNTMGWKIASQVKFAEATEKLETSVGKVATTENLNVSVGGAAEVPLNKVVFPYDTTTTLTFDSNNVEYVTLTYSNGESETFTEAAANTYEVYANSSKGTVTGYTVGLWSNNEYKGFLFSNQLFDLEKGESIELNGGIAVASYFGDEEKVVIPSTQRVRNRNFKTEIKGYSGADSFFTLFITISDSIIYPVQIENEQFNSLTEVLEWIGNNADNFMTKYPESVHLSFETLCETDSILYSNKKITAFSNYAFIQNTKMTSITIPNGVTTIGTNAFFGCDSLTSITIPDSVTKIEDGAFEDCLALAEIYNLSSLNIIIGDYSNGGIGLYAKVIHTRTDEPTRIVKENNIAYYVEGSTKIALVLLDKTVISATIANDCTEINQCAFISSGSLKSIEIPTNIINIRQFAFRYCDNLTTTIGSGWVKVEDGSAVDASTLLKDIDYDIRRNA